MEKKSGDFVGSPAAIFPPSINTPAVPTLIFFSFFHLRALFSLIQPFFDSNQFYTTSKSRLNLQIIKNSHGFRIIQRKGEYLAVSILFSLRSHTNSYITDYIFQAAAVKQLKQRPTDDELLELYGLFKQATVGDNTTERPGVFDFKGKYKWDAWKKLEGLSQEEAEKKYIEFADKLIEKYN